MRYFVTGATGFIGGRVARQLVAAGHEVVAVVRHPAKAGDLVALGVSVAQGDITNKESLRAPMQGVDGVFHIAGWYKIATRGQRQGRRINVKGTRNVLELMRELGVPKGVYTSTIAVFSDTHGKTPDETYRYDGPFLSAYERSKWIAHYQVAEPMIAAGLPLVIVQPGVTYGPGDTSGVHETLVRYLHRKLPLLPTRAEYSWVHVDDVARGHLLAMEQGTPGESYIIAGPRHTVVEAAELAERITGIPAPTRRVGPRTIKAMAATMGVVEKIVPIPADYTAEYLRTSDATYLGDSSKARRDLGYDPRPLEEGIVETLRYEMQLLGTR